MVDKVRGVWMGTGKGRTSFEMRYSVLCTIVVRLLTPQNTVEEGEGCSLIPRPLPDFISQLWRRIGRRPEINAMSWARNGGLS